MGFKLCSKDFVNGFCRVNSEKAAVVLPREAAQPPPYPSPFPFPHLLSPHTSSLLPRARAHHRGTSGIDRRSAGGHSRPGATDHPLQRSTGPWQAKPARSDGSYCVRGANRESPIDTSWMDSDSWWCRDAVEGVDPTRGIHATSASHRRLAARRHELWWIGDACCISQAQPVRLGEARVDGSTL